MRAVGIIIKKRDKHELTLEEIEFFVRGFTNGDIPDYQTSAFAMAILLNGMTPRETTDLTLAMAHSGSMLDLSDVVDLAVDKHSSGGVGDKTSLSVLPIVGACGLPVGKMSGRGLGFSGGIPTVGDHRDLGRPVGSGPKEAANCLLGLTLVGQVHVQQDDTHVLIFELRASVFDIRYLREDVIVSQHPLQDVAECFFGIHQKHAFRTTFEVEQTSTSRVATAT